MALTSVCEKSIYILFTAARLLYYYLEVKCKKLACEVHQKFLLSATTKGVKFFFVNNYFLLIFLENRLQRAATMQHKLRLIFADD